jgi:hypothetical protein
VAKKPALALNATAQQNNKKVKAKKPRTIETEIQSIFRMLCSSVADNAVVKMEKPAQYSTCKGLISIYKQGMLLQTMYAFYSSSQYPTKLGSVAIYGSDVATYQQRILKRGTLFGYQVVRATLEMGRREFLDVTLAV